MYCHNRLFYFYNFSGSLRTYYITGFLKKIFIFLENFSLQLYDVCTHKYSQISWFIFHYNVTNRVWNERRKVEKYNVNALAFCFTKNRIRYVQCNFHSKAHKKFFQLIAYCGIEKKFCTFWKPIQIFDILGEGSPYLKSIQPKSKLSERILYVLAMSIQI